MEQEQQARNGWFVTWWNELPNIDPWAWLLTRTARFTALHLLTALVALPSVTWLYAPDRSNVDAIRPSLPLLASLAAMMVCFLILVVGVGWGLRNLGNRRRLAGDALLSWQARTLLIFATLALLLAGVVYTALNDVLLSLHRPGDPAYNLGATIKLFAPHKMAGGIREAVHVWHSFVDTAVTFRNGQPFQENPLRLTLWITFLDSLIIVPAYATIFVLLQRSVAQAITKGKLDRDPQGGRWLLKWLYLAVLADWLENLLSFVTVAWGVILESPNPLPNWMNMVGNWPLRVLVVPLWLSSCAKVGGLIVAGLALLVYWVLILRRPRSRNDVTKVTRGSLFWYTIRRMRLPIILIVLIYLILNVPQSIEVIRRWQDHWSEGLLALAATAIFSAACGFYGWIARVEDYRDPNDSLTKRRLDSAAPTNVSSSRQPTPPTAPSGLLSTIWSWATFWIVCAFIAAIPLVAYQWQQQDLCKPPGACNSTSSDWSLSLIWYALRAALPAVILLRILPRVNEAVGQLPISRVARKASGRPGIVQPSKLREAYLDPPANSPPSDAFSAWLLSIAVFAVVGLAASTAATELLVYNALRDRLEPSNFLLVAAALILLGTAALATVMIPDYTPTVPPQTREERNPPRWQNIEGWTKVALNGSVVAFVVWLLTAIAFFADTDLRLALGLMRNLGTIAVLLIALTFLLVIATGVILLANNSKSLPRPAGLLHIFGMRRPPVITLMILWALLGSSSLFSPDIHRIREQRATNQAERQGMDLKDVFNYWRDDRCLRAPDGPSVPENTRPVVPIIFVAAEGGGIRAAAWSAYVLNRTLDTHPEFPGFCGDGVALSRSDFVFAQSGISGGSVGIATQTSYLLTAERPDLPSACTQEPCHAGWVEAALGADHLAPVVAWMLAVEFPRSFLAAPVHTDRAAVLERSVESGWNDQLFKPPSDDHDWLSWAPSWLLRPKPAPTAPAPPTFFGLRKSTAASPSPSPSCTPDLPSSPEQGRRTCGQPAIPLLVLNSASVEGGCRFAVTPLETNGRDWQQPVGRCIAPLAAAPSASAAPPSPGNTASPSPPPHGFLGSTIDLVDLLCKDQDLPLSTAAFISGRFPYISPSANIEGCLPVPPGGDPAVGQRYRPQTYLVDGGYLEGSGSGSILALYEALEPLIRNYNADDRARAVLVPVLLTISNGYGEPAGPDLLQVPPQLTVPPSALGNIRNGTTANAKQSANLAFTARDTTLGVPFDCTEVPRCFPCGEASATTAQTCPGRFASFALQAHPGPRAELGWTLSRVAFEDFVSQYDRLYDPTGAQSSGDLSSPGLIVDHWFAGLRPK